MPYAYFLANFFNTFWPERKTGRGLLVCPSIARLMLWAWWGSVFFLLEWCSYVYFLTNFFNTFWPERKKCSKTLLGAAQKCYRTAKLADRMQNSTAMQSQTCIRFDRSLLCCAKRIFVQMRLVCAKPTFSFPLSGNVSSRSAPLLLPFWPSLPPHRILIQHTTTQK